MALKKTPLYYTRWLILSHNKNQPGYEGKSGCDRDYEKWINVLQMYDITSLKEMGKKVTDRNHFKTVFCLDTIRLKTNSIS